MGIIYTRSNYVKSVNATIPEGLATTKIFEENEMPSFGISMLTALVPVAFMAISTFAELGLDEKSPILKYTTFLGDPPVALLITVLICSYTLGIARGKRMEEVMKSLSGSVKAVAMITLVIGAGGAFKQVIVDAGVGRVISDLTQGLNISPIILAWIIAALLRTAVDSATVAITTASGIVLPLVATSGVSPELMVLATSCGSVFASHVNDPGFWMFKEYFNLPVGQAIKVRTVYSSLLAVIGLIGVLILNMFFLIIIRY